LERDKLTRPFSSFVGDFPSLFAAGRRFADAARRALAIGAALATAYMKNRRIDKARSRVIDDEQKIVIATKE